VVISVGDFAKHRFVEEIVLGAVEGHPRNAIFNAELDKLKLFPVYAFQAGLRILRR